MATSRLAPKPKLILVKLGGSLITDKKKPEAPRRALIERLTREIASARETDSTAILLGHGSGSFGHAAALAHGIGGPRRGERTSPRAASLTQDAAARLHRLVISALLACGESPFSLAPSGFMSTRHGRATKLALDPLRSALAHGLLPVVYGDVVTDSAEGTAIASTETVLTAIARRLHRRAFEVTRALWVGETPGVFDLGGKVIPTLNLSSWGLLAINLRGAAGGDVTGGIRHRVESAALLARQGIPSLIFDGREPGALARALAGEDVAGTRFEVTE